MPSGGNKKSPGSAKGKHQQSSKASSSKAPASATGNEAANTSTSNQTGDEDQNSGFAEYLRSSQGSEMLKLFVVANSIVMFLTVAWPQMKRSYELLMSFFGGEEEEEF